MNQSKGRLTSYIYVECNLEKLLMTNILKDRDIFR